MSEITTGFCFKDGNGSEFLVTQTAVLYKTGEPVYICQELTGKHRQVIFDGADIAKIAGGVSESGKSANTESVSDDWPYSEYEQAEESEDSDDGDAVNENLIRFLDADDCREKLEILYRSKDQLTDAMLESMALSMDYDLGNGSFSEKYAALEKFLKTRKQYESKRTRR